MILNRIIQVNSKGITYQADPKHARLLVEGLGLDDAKGVNVPGPAELTGIDEALPDLEAHACRRLAARCNYLALDRPAVQYATKEDCKHMASPTKHGWKN